MLRTPTTSSNLPKHLRTSGQNRAMSTKSAFHSISTSALSPFPTTELECLPLSLKRTLEPSPIPPASKSRAASRRKAPTMLTSSANLESDFTHASWSPTTLMLFLAPTNRAKRISGRATASRASLSRPLRVRLMEQTLSCIYEPIPTTLTTVNS